MTIRTLLWPIIFAIIFGITSCSNIINGIFGIKSIKTIDKKTIFLYSKKYHIPETELYELDTTYLSFLYRLDTSHYKNQIYNHHQPLQILYYDSARQFTSFHTNCYAGGVPNLKWNRQEKMQTFPPKQQTPLDSILPFDKHFNYLLPLSRTQRFSRDTMDYFIIVYWSRHMGRQSKRLIQFVQANIKLAGDKKTKVLYVNTDNFWTAANNKRK